MRIFRELEWVRWSVECTHGHSVKVEFFNFLNQCLSGVSTAAASRFGI